MPQRRDPLTTTRRTGTVLDIIGGGYVTVAVGGDTDHALELYCMRSYLPVIGDTVVILAVQGDMIVLGAINNCIDSVGGRANAMVLLRRSTTLAVANGAWTEFTFDTIERGEDIASPCGQLALDAGGHVAVPADGLYVVQVQAVWPSAAYTRTYLAVDVSGLGLAGSTNRTRRDVIMPGTTFTHYNASEPMATWFDAGDTLAGYAFQTSGGSVTVAANSLRFSGYRVA